MAIGAKHIYRFGAFRLDATDRLLYRDGELVALAPKVVDTLLLLVSNSGRVLTKDEMMKQLWPDSFVEDGTLSQYISLLRKALGDSAGWVENHPRRGYRFTAPIDEIGAGPASPPLEGQEKTANQAKPAAPTAGRSGMPITRASVGLAVLLALAAAVWLSARRTPSQTFNSVAVLPFRTVSDAGEDYLADGITEALITKLANLKGLRVVSYSRARRFKDSPLEATQIGRELGVEVVIEGTVRTSSGQFRVSVHGVNVRSGDTLWAIDRLESKPERLLEFEGQLAEAAAQRVRGQLTSQERDAVTRSSSSNDEAYSLVLRARRAEPAKAVEMLERAVRLDPGYADAYAWLALAQLQTYNLWRSGPETLRKAISNANLALSKDPNAASAVRALVHIHHATGREVEALVLARRALENSPDDLDAMAAAAEAYFRNGLYDRAIPLFERALAGEPASREIRSQLARMYLYLGQEKRGLEVISPLPVGQAGYFGMLLYAESGQMGKAVEIARAGSTGVAYGFRAYLEGHVLAAAGDHAGAREKWTRAVRSAEVLLNEHEHPGARAITAMIYAKLGRREEALRNVDRALQSDGQNPVLLFFVSQTRALLGLRADALATLKAAVDNGFFNLPMIRYLTRPGLGFHGLRADREFRAMLADLDGRINELRARY